jgi:hypothetical protein
MELRDSPGMTDAAIAKRTAKAGKASAKLRKADALAASEALRGEIVAALRVSKGIVRAAARELNRRGVPTMAGGTEWRQSTLSKVVARLGIDPTDYAG